MHREENPEAGITTPESRPVIHHASHEEAAEVTQETRERSLQLIAEGEQIADEVGFGD